MENVFLNDIAWLHKKGMSCGSEKVQFGYLDMSMLPGIRALRSLLSLEQTLKVSSSCLELQCPRALSLLSVSPLGTRLKKETILAMNLFQ